MALECPNCSFEIMESDKVCPECGSQITEKDIEQQKHTFAYSKFADLALVVGQIATFLGALGNLFMVADSLFKQKWFDGLVYYPLYFFTAVGLNVVFARMRLPKTKPSKRKPN